MAKYDIGQRVLQDLPDFAEKQRKYAEDKAAKIDWKPTFSRIKILPDPEQISAIIDTAPGHRETLTRGTIVGVGPEAGYRDGVEIERFYVGQRVLFLSSHIMRYRGADGVEHCFLKENADVNSIIAIEPRASDEDARLGSIRDITKSFNEKANAAK